MVRSISAFWLAVIIVVGLVLVSIRAIPGGLQARNAAPATPAASSCVGQAQVSRRDGTGVIRFVGTQPGHAIARPHDAQGSPESVARAYLTACGTSFGIHDQASQLRLSRAVEVDSRRSIVRFQQVQDGIPILGAELILHVDNAQDILAVVAKASTNPIVSATPTISPAAAVQAASDVVAKTYNNSGTVTGSTPQLWIYDPALIGPGTGIPTLVWRTEVKFAALLPVRELVLVDAENGSVVLHFNQVEFARSRETYTANNGSGLPGTLECDEGNTCLSPPKDSQVAAAHLFAADTYNFFFSNFGRDSLDNAGLTIRSTVHYSSNFQDSLWNGSQAVFGDGLGLALADDIVAHELTHGVTQYTSNLLSYYQSGAINESLSDVFGEFVDLTNGHGTDTAGVRWLIGEDVTGLSARAIRNMQNPPEFNQPDKMTSSFYFTGTGDSGGIHTNGGINNKAAFLIVDGGTFNSQTITGIGITKTAKIYYEVETHLLTSGADYGDLYDALYQACNNLTGSAGITAADCTQVRNATIAVEMNSQPIAGYNTNAPVCSSGLTPVNVFFDDLESGSGNFAFSSIVGTVRWTYDGPSEKFFAHSGSHFLYANDSPGELSGTDTSVTMTSNVLVPQGAFLHFAQAFGFELGQYDGGVVEYSTDSGANWHDAGSLFEVNGYTGTIFTGFSNPLSGRSAFVNDSHGYISSRLNLASLAGQSLRFRWRMGLDTSSFNRGWWLDDVRIYTCPKRRIGQITSN